MFKLRAVLTIVTICLKILCSLLASLILSPVLSIGFLFFAIYKQLLRLALRIRYGTRFGGLLRGADVVHTMEEPSKAIVNGVLIATYDQNCDTSTFSDDALTLLTKFWFDKPDSFPKFKSIFLKSMGYSYKVKDKLNPDECIRKMKIVGNEQTEITKTEFMEVLADCCNQPLPRNELILWEALVGVQPVRWKSDMTKKYYPVVFRVHHGVADGVSLLKLLTGVFADCPHFEIVSTTEYKQTETVQRYNTCFNDFWVQIGMAMRKRAKYFLGKIFTVVQVLVMYPAVCFTQLVFKCNDSNILHGPTLTGQKVLALTVEENSEYVEKIKRIKQKVVGASFSHILITAYSASLCDYYTKKSNQRDKSITCLVPLFPGSLDLQHLVPGQLSENSISFKNGYSFILPSLPLFVSNGSKETIPLLTRLNMIQKEMNISNYAIYYKVNYFLMCIVAGIFPQPLITSVLKGSHCTTLISILAGPQRMTFGGGIHLLDSVAFWVPHVKNIGVSFSVLTYCNRLHVGVSADKALISTQSDAQSIIDGVFRHLDNMENELSVDDKNKR